MFYADFRQFNAIVFKIAAKCPQDPRGRLYLPTAALPALEILTADLDNIAVNRLLVSPPTHRCAP